MATFVLVHGAWHGPWCWKYLSEELIKKGHEVITPELPIDKADATTQTYAQVVADAIGDKKDTIVVGHSMAGLVVPLVADLVKVKKIIYLCGVLRRPGHSLAEDSEAGLNAELNVPGFDKAYTDDGNGFSSLTKDAVPFFYADCTAEIQNWAFENLRKQHTYWTDVSPQKDWPNVPLNSIICTEDKSISPSWSEKVAKDWLHTEPIKIPGSHSPFLSRPEKLAEVLDDLAK